MSLIPILHSIIFYLALVFMPAGTQQFTITGGSEPRITFSRQADGTWSSKEENGGNGVWTAKGLQITETRQDAKNDTDLSTFVKVDTDASQKKQVTLKGIPVTVLSTGTTVTLSQGEGGMLKQPVVITYTTN